MVCLWFAIKVSALKLLSFQHSLFFSYFLTYRRWRSGKYAKRHDISHIASCNCFPALLLLSSVPATLVSVLPLIPFTFCTNPHHCSSEIRKHRQECASFLTLRWPLSANKKGESGEEERMLRSLEWFRGQGKKERAFCGCLSDRIWGNSMALAFGKIASVNGH